MVSRQLTGWLAVGLGAAWMVALTARGAIHANRTGSLGVHFPTGEWRAGGWAAAALANAGIASLIVGIVLHIRGRLEPWFGSWLSMGFGVGLVLAGALVAIGGQAAMGGSWRVGVDLNERTELVTKGPFAFSRNPIYLGVTLSIGGLTILVPSWLSVIAIVCQLAGSQVQVRLVEEPYLVKTHGDEFRRYASRVGRFLPGLGRGVSR